MDKETYEKEKADIIQRLGPPVTDLHAPVNESAKQLQALRVQYMLAVKQSKKQASESATESLQTSLNSIPEPKSTAKPKYQRLPPIVVLNEDLKGFHGIEQEIVKSYFLDRSLTAQQLGHTFNLPYQKVAGVFRKAEFKLLRLKYFEAELAPTTLDAVLQLIKHGNPNAVSAAINYLGIMQPKEQKDDANRLVNPEHQKYLAMLAEWLESDTKEPLTFTKNI